jgi:hypothetical protein
LAGLFRKSIYDFEVFGAHDIEPFKLGDPASQERIFNRQILGLYSASMYSQNPLCEPGGFNFFFSLQCPSKCNLNAGFLWDTTIMISLEELRSVWGAGVVQKCITKYTPNFGPMHMVKMIPECPRCRQKPVIDNSLPWYLPNIMTIKIQPAGTTTESFSSLAGTADVPLCPSLEIRGRSYKLCGVVYWGKYYSMYYYILLVLLMLCNHHADGTHFKAHVTSPNGVSWEFDGMKNGGKLVNKSSEQLFNFEITESFFAHTLFYISLEECHPANYCQSNSSLSSESNYQSNQTIDLLSSDSEDSNQRGSSGPYEKRKWMEFMKGCTALGIKGKCNNHQFLIIILLY